MIQWTFRAPVQPSHLLAWTAYFSEVPGTILLWSGGDLDSATTSYLMLFPIKQVCIEINSVQTNPWDQLKRQLGPMSDEENWPKWVGYIGYEMGHYADREIVLPHLASDLPDAYFQQSLITLRYDHQSMQAEVRIQDELIDKLPIADQAIARSCFVEEGFWNLEKRFSALDSIGSFAQMLYEGETASTYQQWVKTVQDQIRAGQVYQACISQQFIYQTDQPFN